MRHNDKNCVKEATNPPLDPPELLPQILHTFYERVVSKGNESRYQPEMLFGIPKSLSLETARQRSENLLKKVRKANKLKIAHLIQVLAKLMTIDFILFGLQKTVQMLLPFTLKAFIGWFEDEESETSSGLFHILGIAVLIFLRGFLTLRAGEYWHKTDLGTKNFLSWAVIQKVFSLSPRAARHIGYGKIAVMVNSDVNKVARTTDVFLHLVLDGYELVATLVLLYCFIGWLWVATVLIILFTSFFQKYCFQRFFEVDKVRRLNMDQRSVLTDEIVTGIKSIKFNAAEKVLNENIDKIRFQERSQLQSILNSVGINMALSANVSPIAAFTVFTLNQIFCREMDTGTIIATIMYLTRISFTMKYLIKAGADYMTSLVSRDRIGGLLLLEEKQGDGEQFRRQSYEIEKGSVEFRNSDASWDDFELRDKIQKFLDLGPISGKKQQEEHKETELGLLDYREDAITREDVEKIVLRDINLIFEKGEFVALLGGVGSGKSSLLRAIIGELKTQKGKVLSHGSIAYVSQTAFLVNDTLRNNILFGKPYDKAKYNKVLKICQLLPDLDILPSRDFTEIGERRINLSGGQKQRISLARAVYSDSDIYLIDDCLSALDAHVGKAVLEKVVLKHLKGKTVIMASHHTHFLDKTDHIYVIKKGRIVVGGCYPQVKKTKEYQELLATDKKSQENSNYPKIELSSSDEENERSQPRSRTQPRNHNHLDAFEGEKSLREVQSTTRTQNYEKINHQLGRLTKEEHRSQGIVGPEVILFYIKNGSWAMFLLILATFGASTILM